MNASTDSSQASQTPGADSAVQARPRSLTRSSHDRMLGGVAGGIARYVGVDVLFVRIAFAVLTVLGGAGIPLYLICWLLIPDERTRQSLATEFMSDVQAHRN